MSVRCPSHTVAVVRRRGGRADERNERGKLVAGSVVAITVEASREPRHEAQRRVNDSLGEGQDHVLVLSHHEAHDGAEQRLGAALDQVAVPCHVKENWRRGQAEPSCDTDRSKGHVRVVTVFALRMVAQYAYCRHQVELWS